MAFERLTISADEIASSLTAIDRKRGPSSNAASAGSWTSHASPKRFASALEVQPLLLEVLVLPIEVTTGLIS